MGKTAILLTIAMFLPLAGCLGGNGAGPAAINLALFGLEEIQRGDPEPLPAQDCDDLLHIFRERAGRQAAVSLYQAVEDVGRNWGWGDDVMVMEAVDESADMDGAESAPMAATAGDSAQRGSAADAEVTGTNNQEAGVDEADILKTDGEWTYVLRHQELIILRSDRIGDLEEHAVVRLTGGGWGGQLLLEDRGTADPSDDRLLVIRNGQLPVDPEEERKKEAERRSETDADTAEPGMMADIAYYEPYAQGTHITTYGLANRSSPNVVDERWIEGDLSGARLVDGTAYIVTHHWARDMGLRTWAYPGEQDLAARGLDWRDLETLDKDAARDLRMEIAQEALAHNEARLEATKLSDFMPRIFRGVGGLTFEEPITASTCRATLATPDDTGRSVSTIFAIDMDADVPDTSSTRILGGRPIVYGALDAIVLASSAQDTWWFWAQPALEEATNLHWFDLDGLDVTHRASGRTLGIIQDQFGIDVHDDRLRVATTTGTWGRWWLPDPTPMLNHIAVMEATGSTLVETGRVGGIAPGERIWSARFTDDRAYIVTFEQIDPLWIIDLSDPDKPTILGELEIPGVSTYIHPLSEDALLTIGLGPGPDGLGLDWGRIQVSLFDISDPTRPTRADLLDVTPGGQGWSWSGAVHEHKAFTYWGALGKLAIPVSTTYEWVEESEGRRTWTQERHVGLKLIDVDTDAMTLTTYGDVDQNSLLPDTGDYWYGGDVQRSYFLGNPGTGDVSVYAMSDMGMTAHDLATLDLLSAVPFDLDQREYYGYPEEG